MIEFLTVIFQIAVLYLLADLTGGLFHWAEDTLGSADSPIWGRIFVQPNEIHHERPGDMIKIHWLKNNIPILSFTAFVLLVALAFDAVTWQLLVFAVFAGANQQVHRFAHAPRARLPGFIKWAQRKGIMQDARHHWVHHTDPHTSHYCVLTPWLNPVLDRVGFWRGMERLCVPIFGAPRRPDLKDRSWYRE